MKSLVRWGATLGIVGSVFFGGLSGTQMQAIALPQDQIVSKLREVPVFTIANPKGEFLVLTTKSNPTKPVSQVGFFISQQDAQKFLEQRIKKENPQLASTMQVKVLSMADYYKIVQENKKKKESVVFTLVPKQEQVESARNILNQSGQKGQQFNGCPLFVARLKKDNSYLTIPLGNGKERYIPFYFDREQATALLDQFKKAVPNEANNIEIQVADLYGVLDALNSSNDPGLGKIVLYPSRESIDFIRSLTPKSPAAAPAQKK